MDERAKDNPKGLSRRQLLAGIAASFAASRGFSYAAGEMELSRFRNVEVAANDIIQAIELKLENLAPDKTLFVPVGENHTMPSHRLTIQALLQGLKNRGHAIAFGFEADYDFLAESKIPFASEGIKARLLEKDPDGEHVLRMLSSSDGAFLNANASLQNLFCFCLDQKISTSFNDLAKIYGIWQSVPIDPYDLDTLFFKMLTQQDLHAVWDAAEPMGMRLRNFAMTFNGRAHAREEGAQIYIQHCGGAHVFGDAEYESPYSMSLVNNYALASEECLPVLLSGQNITVDAEAASYIFTNPSVILNDLDDREFSTDWADRDQDKQVYAEERAHMRLLTRHTDIRIYDIDDARFAEKPEMRGIPKIEWNARDQQQFGSAGLLADALDITSP